MRAEALARAPGIEVIMSPYATPKPGFLRKFARRAASRIKRPFDSMNENSQVLSLAREHRPDVLFVYNSRNLRRETILRIKRETGALTVFFTPDDILAPHNITHWLRQSFPIWDVFYTTKSFGVEELRALGVRHPILTGNIFDARVHRPMTPEEVGEEYEKFDLVFVGTFEREREESLRLLSKAGFSVVVHGNPAGLLAGSWERLRKAGVTVRPAALDLDYTKAIHTGKVALGFLRKINRDLITHRSIELPAMGRVMLAEKTAEHDAHFEDGTEYVGFSSEEELIEKARELVMNAELRADIGSAGRARCLASGYDVDTTMRAIAQQIADIKSRREPD